MKKGVSLERALSKLGYMSRSIARKIITDPSFRVCDKIRKFIIVVKIKRPLVSLSSLPTGATHVFNLRIS